MCKWTRAHPRSRGENATRLVTLGILAGSSPLTRGKLAGAKTLADGRRLIPAHAGKTASVAKGLETLSGSSPLTRGKRPHE